MKIRFSFIAALAVLFMTISWGPLSLAQQSTPDAQQPSQQQQQPPDTQAPPPTQTPDQAPQADPAGTKEYVGTVVKQGNKYVFQDAASGETYDIDHQDEVKKFEGKKVRVHGTMDQSAKMIHVQ